MARAKRGPKHNLHTAARSGEVKIVRKLIRRGADVNANNPRGLAAAHKMQNKRASQHITKIVDAPSGESGRYRVIHKSSSETPAHLAALEGHANVIRALHKGGADLNLPEGNWETPAHFAASWNHPDVIRALHEGGADLNVRNSDGYTPAHLAVNDMESIKALHESGADLNAKNDSGETPLSIARARGYTKTVKFLEKLAKKK